jgi:UDP-3-O-[3-hydroxymyristoyl] glucosamine N-acyltransferase
MRLDELAGRIGAELTGDGTVEVRGGATLESARPGQISFVSNPKYARRLATTQASAVVVAPDVKSDGLNLLKAKNPYYAFQQAVVILDGHRKHPFAGVHRNANIDPTARIGEGTVIYPGVYVGPESVVGRDCILYPNVCVYDRCVIGDRVIVHAGAVLGVDGFGFATDAGVHHKIPQIGNLIVEDDVEIGANCMIARGALDSTVIGAGSKLDGLVAIGHGARIGPGGLLVAQVGIAGSTTIGRHVTLGGQVGVVGHITIGDMVTAGAQAGITGDLESKSVIMGTPAIELRRFKRAAALFKKLPEIFQRLKRVESKLDIKPGTPDENDG